MGGLVAAYLAEKALTGRNILLEEGAYRTTVAAVQRIKEERVNRGIPFAKNDIDFTGIIGEEMTPLVTTLGSLKAKRLSTNPHFTSIVVKMFLKVGLREGELIAVGFSGSFPGLNIAVLSAAHTLGLRAIVITSVGASKWGATDVTFTWLDMERILFDDKLFHVRSIAASRGGGLGESFLLSEGHLLAGEAIRRNGTVEIAGNTVKELVQKHWDAYWQAASGAPIRLFVNVGGATVNVGGCDVTRIPPGLVAQVPPCVEEHKGLLHKFFEKGIPVVHLLNIQKLAFRYGVKVFHRGSQPQ